MDADRAETVENLNACIAVSLGVVERLEAAAAQGGPLAERCVTDAASGREGIAHLIAIRDAITD